MIDLIWAQDELLADEVVERLEAECGPDAEVLHVEPDGGDLPTMEEALFAPSLFSVTRLLVVRSAERLHASGTDRLIAASKRDAGGRVALVSVSERPPSRLVKDLGPHAKVHRLQRPRRGELVAWVTKRMKSAGLTPGRDAASALIETVGGSLRDMANAVDQLAIRSGKGAKVEQDDVVRQFEKSAEQPVWALFDALLSRDRHQRSFDVLHMLLDQGHDAMAVLFALVSQTRLVIRARSAIERSPGLGDSQLAQVLGVSPGRAGVVKRQASAISWDTLLRMYDLFAEADVELKGGEVASQAVMASPLPPVMVLERVLGGILSGHTESVHA
ncbi:MAG TPA: DNA polymerase III subunit delta [Actinomycetota bacterium]|nr:DNA polymerase III subunit delta [Actinomycetota bacterium]